MRVAPPALRQAGLFSLAGAVWRAGWQAEEKEPQGPRQAPRTSWSARAADGRHLLALAGTSPVTLKKGMVAAPRRPQKGRAGTTVGVQGTTLLALREAALDAQVTGGH